MKRMFFIFLLCSLFYACSKADDLLIKKLPTPFHKKFEKINIKKIFSINFIGGGNCIPFSQGILAYESLDNEGKRLNLKYFDLQGKLKKEVPASRGQGPTDIGVISLWLLQDDKILFIDKNSYLKMINPLDLKITTIEKISNKIEDYFNKFVFALNSSTDIEYFNGQTITSFEKYNFNTLNYYIVSYDGNFNRFKIIHEVKKELPKSWIKTRKSERKVLFSDYNNLIILQRNLAVDWKNGFIYFFSDCEKPEISRIDFRGKQLTKIILDIDSKNFFVDKKKIDIWYRWAIFDVPRMFKTKYKAIYSEKTPVLRDIDILGEWLLVTTGKRNWDTFENEVLVYKLSDLSFLGSFFIPTGDWPSMKFGKHFVTKRIIEKDDDFFWQCNCYCIEKK